MNQDNVSAFADILNSKMNRVEVDKNPRPNYTFNIAPEPTALYDLLRWDLIQNEREAHQNSSTSRTWSQIQKLGRNYTQKRNFNPQSRGPHTEEKPFHKPTEPEAHKGTEQEASVEDYPHHFTNENQRSAFKFLKLFAPDLVTTFSLQDLKAAFRSAALRLHPDQGGNSQDFLKARQSYHLLKGLVL